MNHTISREYAMKQGVIQRSGSVGYFFFFWIT